MAFVVSAGNEFDEPIHAAGELAAGQSANVPFAFPEPSPINLSTVTIWYGADDAYSTTVRAPDGTSFGPVARGDVATWQYGEVTITIDAQAVPDHPDGNTTIILEWPAGQAADGQWAFSLYADEVVGTGRWDAWLPEGHGAGSGTEGFTAFVAPYGTVVEPGNAAGAITVAAYVTKDCWLAMDGEYCVDPLPVVGDIASFSSAGPTRDGRPKPDLAAPGQAIIAARSAASEIDPYDTTSDGRFVPHDGTSMAAPHVTGAIALMFQLAPTLDADSILSVLGDTTLVDDYTGQVWNPRWGMGRLNARGAALAVGLNPTEHTLFLPLTGTG